eukprot:160092_1
MASLFIADHCNLEDDYCINVNRIIKIMNESCIKHRNSSLDILEILNDYIHTIIYHNDDNQFESIAHQCNNCNIESCKYFPRIYRRKYMESLTQTHEEEDLLDIVHDDILRKIHNYFIHAYDMGYRLTTQDREMIYKQSCKYGAKQINNNTFDEYVIDPTLIETQAIIKNKQSNMKDNKVNRMISVDDPSGKYLPLWIEGNRFHYDQETNVPEHSSVQLVVPKHSSFKEELITNDVCRINSEQFNMEYQKARIHFSSYYRKRYHSKMGVEHILALMFYCNYSELSYRFSKTYRDYWDGNNVINVHSNYYFLGKYLDEAVNIHGTSITDGKIKRFYHGTSEKLLFHAEWFPAKRSMNCPLSTTSSFAVAVNFAVNGIIIEFQQYHDLSKQSFTSSKYYSTRWLSDYGYENEYLFLNQREHAQGLSVENIWISDTGQELDILIKALTAMNNTYFGSNILQKDIYGKPYEFEVLQMILGNNFETSEEYIKQLINQCCNWRFKAYIYVHELQNCHSIWHHIFRDSKYESVDIAAAVRVFPLLSDYAIQGTNKSNFALEVVLSDILYSWSDAKHAMDIHVNEIRIHDIPWKLGRELIFKYQELFGNVEFNVVGPDKDMNATLYLEPK